MQAEHAACGNFDYFKNLPTLPDGIQVPVCYVPCLSTQLGALADEYYDHPSQVLDVVAVTGTNGKTSTYPLDRPGGERSPGTCWRRPGC